MQPARILLTFVLVAAFSCAPEVPDEPTWAEDIAPILAANCVRCHTVPATGGAPSGFRLDSYDDWVADDGTVIRGAATMASFIYVRIDSELFPMPPRFPLTARQSETVENWKNAVQADGRPPRGPPRPGNQAPEMTISTTEEGGVLVIDYEIRDPDRDIVLGELRADDMTVTRELHSGAGQVSWDIGALPEATYQLSAVLDDGSERHTVDLEPYTVSRADANAAPTVTIVSPRKHAIAASNEAANFDIVVDIADPDSAPEELTMTIEAHLGDTTVPVPVIDPLVLGENTVSWPIDALEAAFTWRLSVTVSDGSASRTARSGEFIISHATTTETFDSIRSVIAGHCYCHAGPDSFVPGLNYDFREYTQQGEYPGVYETRDRIFLRAFREPTMPPRSEQSPLGPEDAERLRTWLLAGAPL